MSINLNFDYRSHLIDITTLLKITEALYASNLKRETHKSMETSVSMIMQIET